MKLAQVTRKDVSYVELQRDKKHSLGFTIKDGTEEERRPIIKNVSIKGPAAKSYAVAKGDVILSVNGVSTAGKKCKDVRRMLDEAGSIVNLQLLYKASETRILGSCVYRKQRLIQRFQKIKGNFGFLLRKCSKYTIVMEYPVISNIKEGSPIHKIGGLQDGDRLLAIDNVSLSWMSLSYIASLLHAKDEAEFTFEYSVRVDNFVEMGAKVDLEIDASVTDLGISFCEEYSKMYINSIRRGSAAERCGIFNEGDLVLSINDIDAKNLNISKANIFLKNTKESWKISFISNRRKDETPKKTFGLSSSTKNPSTLNESNRINRSLSSFHKRTHQSNTDNFSEDSATDFNNESSSSSTSGSVIKKHNFGRKKTYSDTMRLTLKKEGCVDFGLDISGKSIINAIKPKSPAHKAGVLKLGDRILAINGIRTSKLSSRHFSLLKSKAFSADTITLTVQFDVYDEDFLFGTFEVVLDRSLKIGLTFKDMKKGCPMVISCVEKGSAAHRCGQLFPSDQVTYFQIKKIEVFDPLTRHYNREENLIVTVLRDPKNVLKFNQEDELSGCRAPNPSACYVNPSFYPEDSMQLSGQNFDVKKTIVHSSRENSVVVDHEVTLYRDSSRFDFGILLGVDPTTGYAYAQDIRLDGPADKSGVIKKLDRILEVNGELVNKNVEHSVVELFSRAGDKVDLIVRRVYKE